MAESTPTSVAALREKLSSAHTEEERLAALLALGEQLSISAPAEAEPLLAEAAELGLKKRSENHFGRACWLLCDIKRNAGEMAGSRTWAERLGEAATELASPFLEGYYHYALAANLFAEGDNRATALEFAVCHERWKAAGSRIGEITALNGLATIAGVEGRPADQLEHLQSCLAIADEIDNRAWRLRLAHSLGWPLIQLGRWEDAAATFYRALELSQSPGASPMTSAAYIGLGDVLMHRNELDRAAVLFDRAIEMGRKKQSYPSLYRTALIEAGLVRLRQSNLTAADQLFAEALNLCQSPDTRGDIVTVSFRMTEAALKRGLLSEADRLLDRAESTAAELNLGPAGAEALLCRGLVQAARNDHVAAAFSTGQAFDALRDAGEGYSLADALFQYGRQLYLAGNESEAVKQLSAALRLLRRLGMIPAAVEAIILLARIESATGSGPALMHAVSHIATLRLSPRRFLKLALKVSCELLGCSGGTLWAGEHVVSARGNTIFDRNHAEPIMLGAEPVGAVYLNRSQGGRGLDDSLSVGTLLAQLAGTLKRLSGQEPTPTPEIFRDIVATLATNEMPIFIRGERGSGRKTLARLIHESSRHSLKPFAVLRCVDAHELLRDELLGHAADAEADVERFSGRLADVDRGTLVLEHAEHIRPELWSELMPAAHETRLIAFSDRPMTAPSGFTEVDILPLRERKAEIAGLARQFIDACAQEFGRAVNDITPAALERLNRHDWPGNVTELREAIEWSVMLASGSSVDVADLPPTLR